MCSGTGPNPPFARDAGQVLGQALLSSDVMTLNVNDYGGSPMGAQEAGRSSGTLPVYGSVSGGVEDLRPHADGPTSNEFSSSSSSRLGHTAPIRSNLEGTNSRRVILMTSKYLAFASCHRCSRGPRPGGRRASSTS